MRLIATILSIYVLLLAFAPCADEPVEDTQEVISLVQNDIHPHNDAAQDFCTPFCHCHCCHSHVTFMETHWHSQVIQPYSEKATPYTQQKEYRFPFSIFQPPRV